jgi:prolyl oligopeptidase
MAPESTINADIVGEPSDTHLWLEQTRDPAALAWATSRTLAAKVALSKLALYPQLRSELDDAVASGGATPIVFFLGDKLARVRTDVDHRHGILELSPCDADGQPTFWRTIFDVGAFNAAEGRAFTVQWGSIPKLALPPSYERCMLPLAPAGGDEVELREFDLSKGVFIEGGFRTSVGKTDAVWLNQDRLLIAHTLGDAPRSANGAPRQAYLWDRGTLIEDARPVLTLAPSDALMLLNAVGSGRARRAVVTRIHNYSNFSFVIIDQAGVATDVDLPRKLKPFGFLAASERHFLVQLGDAADIKGRRCEAESLIAYDVNPKAPAAERASLVYSFAKDEFANDVLFGFAGTRTGLHFVADRGLRRRLLSARFGDEGWRVQETFAASPGVTLKLGVLGGAGSLTSESLWILQTGYVTPTRIEILAPGKPAAIIHADTPIIDASAFQVEIRKATSRDGVEIEYYLLKPKSPDSSGATPTLMTGYGAFGVTLTPGYFDRMVGGQSLKLWLDRGGALAMPIIRGGGERGEAWHDAALRENRQKSYDDFIAVAEDLVASGFTKPERLGVFGSSNGGLLAATVAVQRPDLFSAAVIDAPVLDMLRYHKLGIGGGLINEYGDPDDPIVRKAILGYSPYQNLRAGRRYPPFMVTVSTEDNRVDPGHARKFVARAEDVGAKAWLIEEAEGGHSVSDSVANPELMAMRMAFLIDALMGSANERVN